MADKAINATSGVTDTTPLATDLIPFGRTADTTARRATVAQIVQAQAASTSETGSVELATLAEARTGTSTALVMTPEDVSAVARKVYNVVSYGAVAGSDSRSAIQDAINAAYTAGGGDVIFPPNAGAYLMTYAGTNPYFTNHRYCLEIKSNVNLIIPVGTTLKLSDTQMTGTSDGADLIVGQDVSNVYIGGGGTLTGNAAGQTGWTGGYVQTAHGQGIFIGGTNGGGNTDILIENLAIDGVFSDAIWIDGYAIDDNKRIKVRDVHISASGEGLLLKFCDGVMVDNVTVDDTDNVSVGDAIEFAACSHVRSANCHVQNNGGGSAFDLYGSHDVALTNFTVDAWNNAVDVQPAAAIGRSTIERVVITGGIINNCPDYGIILEDTGCIDILIQGVDIYSTGQAGIGVPADDTKLTGPVTIQGCTIDGCRSGILANAAVRDFTVQGCNIINSTYDGLTYYYYQGASADDDCRNLIIAGNNISQNGGVGLTISDAGTASAYHPTGLVSGNHINGNTGGIFTCSGDNVKNIKFANNYPGYDTRIINFYPCADLEMVILQGTPYATFVSPGKDQMLKIKFTSSIDIIDKSQSGGDNFNLAGAANFAAVSGNWLCMQYDSSTDEWYELWRRA